MSGFLCVHLTTGTIVISYPPSCAQKLYLHGALQPCLFLLNNSIGGDDLWMGHDRYHALSPPWFAKCSRWIDVITYQRFPDIFMWDFIVGKRTKIINCDYDHICLWFDYHDYKLYLIECWKESFNTWNYWFWLDHR